MTEHPLYWTWALTLTWIEEKDIMSPKINIFMVFVFIIWVCWGLEPVRRCFALGTGSSQGYGKINSVLLFNELLREECLVGSVKP